MKTGARHIHFIGICGVAMSALALAFREQGWKVTGSDAGFYPPISDNLKKNKIDFYPGWHPEKMTAGNAPDLIVVGNVASSTNPEWMYAQEHRLNYLSYPEAIAKYFVKQNSIVCAGTYGKTTSAALLAWILGQAGYNPSYMFGGLVVDDAFASARMADGHWSALEGDEYKSARWDNSPKFTHYSPTHLLLTAVQWDHADVFPTVDDYYSAFKNLAESLPAAGLAVVSENVPADMMALFKCQVIKYGKNSGQFTYQNPRQTKNGLEFIISDQTNNFKITAPILGQCMAENICGCFALARTIGIGAQIIARALAQFPGLKRRLQKRGTINGAHVYDDIAHSPAKASFALKTLRQIYAGGKIYAVFEPNTGNRRSQLAAGYDHAFRYADEVTIPRLTKIKIDHDEPTPMDGQRLAEVIARTHQQTNYFADDDKLVNYLKTKTQPGDVVVFLGSHGFRGMIEEILNPNF